MYPSNNYFASNNINNDNLMSPSYNLDQNVHPPLYNNYLSPLYHCENDVFVQHMSDLIYLQQQSQMTEVNAQNTIGSEVGEHSDNIGEILGESKSKGNESMVMKEIPKTSLKKDRHSKIDTAQGPRDRRMRLSLQVARDFFDLQDKLGFNKPSKTVEWLLNKSRSAIKDLATSNANNPSSTSECEVVSQERGKHLASLTKEAKNPRGSIRKSALNPLSKESREKARARARERTREKRSGIGSKIGFETTTCHQMDSLESWPENENNGSQLQELGHAGEPSSSMIFNYHTHEDGISHEHQFVDFDLYGKPWE